MTVISANTLAPDFTLPDETGQQHTLSQYRGQPVVLYFYPKDNTSGCTAEACSFRDDYSAYQEAGVLILGVSPDSIKSHARFKEKYNLPFPLLADQDHQVCSLYGAWGPKKMMGHSYEGVLRTTFVIGPDGIIQKVFENVKPSEHSAEVLQAVQGA
ncbi:MAG: thioredoxin-dependent thiol peroxidase [Chloroflexi bacterium]|jgi:peroxiredoxin Q/BCP|nr:thioredoxin-dependent thiol peroxidase [Anaerolineaceae bacterium]NMB87245.1 thioredoxin-dependent thiol peroxidase [Chloroflexota bacterium]